MTRTALVPKASVGRQDEDEDEPESGKNHILLELKPPNNSFDPRPNTF